MYVLICDFSYCLRLEESRKSKN